MFRIKVDNYIETVLIDYHVFQKNSYSEPLFHLLSLHISSIMFSDYIFSCEGKPSSMR